jgi:hypothetical protein
MITQSKPFKFDFTPLTVTCTVTVDNTVGDEQVYNSYLGQYIPDYTAVPLKLRPDVRVIDQDGVLTAGSVNGKLANITWTEVIGGTSTLITASNGDYEIVSGDKDNGCIRVKKNVTPDTTLTLKFSAEYTDTRTGQVFQVQGSYLLACSSSAPSSPTLSLDIDPSHLYNPLRDADEVKVKANLYVDGGICPTAKRLFVWDLSHDGKTWEDVGESGLHYFIEVAKDGTYCTVKQSLMGSKMVLRCRVRYSEAGDPSTVALTDSCPAKSVTFTRYIPALQTEIVGASDLPPAATEMEVDLIVTDSQGVVSNYQEVYQPVWYGSAQTAAGNATPTKVIGYGAPCTLQTDFISQAYGSVIGVELVDRGPLTAITDESGNLLTDEKGLILVCN